MPSYGSTRTRWRALTEERWAPTTALDAVETDALADLFVRAVRDGGAAEIHDRKLLEAFGWRRGETTALALWRSLADRIAPDFVPTEYGGALEAIVSGGCLAERMKAAHSEGRTVRSIAGDLVEALRENRPFVG